MDNDFNSQLKKMFECKLLTPKAKNMIFIMMNFERVYRDYKKLANLINRFITAISDFENTPDLEQNLIFQENENFISSKINFELTADLDLTNFMEYFRFIISLSNSCNIRVEKINGKYVLFNPKIYTMYPSIK